MCFEPAQLTANLRTKILDFRGFDSSIILSRGGGISHVHRGSPISFESTKLSRDDLSGEIGRRQEVLDKCKLIVILLLLIIIIIMIIVRVIVNDSNKTISREIGRSQVR